MKHLAFGTGACVLVTLYCGWRFKRRAGGLTGDFLGATQQLAQLGILAGLLWASHG
jgi:adenosylcobinamide-GDP ribazoletransferase